MGTLYSILLGGKDLLFSSHVECSFWMLLCCLCLMSCCFLSLAALLLVPIIPFEALAACVKLKVEPYLILITYFCLFVCLVRSINLFCTSFLAYHSYLDGF